METQEILESNKLIADFMGVMKHEECFGFPVEDNVMKLQHVGEYSTHSFIDEEDNIFYLLTLAELKYNCSFDWLMPVFEKVNLLADVRIHKDCVYVDNLPLYRTTKIVGEGENRYKDILHALYISLVEFIQWHNKQNQQR